MEVPYKLRCSLAGHEKDVRSVCVGHFPERSILSGSRDATARIWVPNEDDVGYREGHAMRGQNHFVSCVCMMPPDDEFPQGLVMTGGTDHTIQAFNLTSTQPLFTLTGHSDNVCAVIAGKFGTLLSGSWDKTARVWLKRKCVMILKGHEAAVWAVALMPESGFMLTGSADKSIKMWRAGKCEKTFTGHTDCVRGLAVLSVSEFLSCSNDASVKRWLTTGECIQTCYSHTNFVYSICVLPKATGCGFATTGEDRTLCIWKDGDCCQTITHPAQSVWSVAVLDNGDIVTGASDGVIRVFTQCADRTADPSDQAVFDELVATSAIPAQIGDIKTDELPGPDVLVIPGEKEGQTVMIRNEKAIQAYQWSMAETRWIKIGDVVGASGGSSKRTYEGKEYDYVFDVDIKEDQPPLKLPYNTTDDPWMAAHDFLENNGVSQMYLDQVVKFIQEQTKGITLGSEQPASVSDPFTGGSRYVPSTEASYGSSTAVPTSDPFTGAGRYVPGAPPRVGGGDTVTAGTHNEFFPQITHLTFDSGNATAILGKLSEFNALMGPDERVSEADLASLKDLISGRNPTAQQLQLLWKLLQWPKDRLFPALDVLRLSVRYAAVAEHFCNDKDGPRFLSHMLATSLSADSPAANQMLVLRTLCNAFQHGIGEDLLRDSHDQIISALVNCCHSSNKNVHVAISSVLLNYSVVYYKNADVEAKAQCVSAAAEITQWQTDAEANFRLLVCVGTLLVDDQNCVELAKSTKLVQFVERCKACRDVKKVADCATLVGELMA